MKLNIPLVGLKWKENEFSAANPDYSQPFTDAFCEMVEKAKTCDSLFNQIVDNGGFTALFNNQSDGFKEAWAKYKDSFPWLSPEFFAVRGLEASYTKTLKPDFKNGKSDVLATWKNYPDLFNIAPPPDFVCEYKNYDDGDRGFVLFGDPNHKLHVMNIHEAGDCVGFTVIFGLTHERPYAVFSFDFSMKFVEGSNEVTYSIQNFKNFNYGLDNEHTLWIPFVRPGFLSLIDETLFE